MSDDRPILAVLGGTGALGAGLALRWARAGYRVIIGSRDRARAEDAAAAAAMVAELPPGVRIEGMDNPVAAATADIVVLSVPFASHDAILDSVRDALSGKILIEVTVPLAPPKVSRVHLPPEGSVAKAAQIRLGDAVRVVAAFHNVAAAHLRDLSHTPDCDALVFGDDRAAREAVIALAAAAGMKGWHGGPIDNAVVGEALTPVLIHINKRHGIDGAGIRITGEATKP